MTCHAHPAASAVDDLAPIARDTLRQVVASDSYAATFQSVGQYRTAILQHIDNLGAADRAQTRMDTTA